MALGKRNVLGDFEAERSKRNERKPQGAGVGARNLYFAGDLSHKIRIIHKSAKITSGTHTNDSARTPESMQWNAANLASLATRRMRVKNFLSTARIPGSGERGEEGDFPGLRWVSTRVCHFACLTLPFWALPAHFCRVFSALFQHFGHILPALFGFLFFFVFLFVSQSRISNNA